MIVSLGWPLLVALVLLVVIAAGSSWLAGIGLATESVVAAVRAALQLGVVSLVIVFCMRHLWAAVAFCLLMFAVAVLTTARRTGVGRAWPWSALAMACGVLPVLLVVFGSGASPFSAAALIPVAGIVIGNMMSGHTLFGRRQFAGLREQIGSYEAALALGMTRTQAIEGISRRTAKEALVPNLDQTRTVGLVTLPGAFVGVLLGGGSALQAGAAQLLVLVGIMAGQNLTVAVANRLMSRALLLPADLKEQLHP